jgi:hypothetical protein
MSIPVPVVAGLNNYSETRAQISPGILVSLTAAPQTLPLLNFALFVTIGIKIGDQDGTGRLVELAAGFVSIEKAVTWTGFYPLHSGDQLYATARGQITGPINIIDRRLTTATTIAGDTTLGDILRTS